ncbi:MAG: helix-turn-helix domain-containing protein [Chloroflexi bacterium]|nr:helix-turn-helix domain-containing protein [Chloroflexota bacterium]
MNNTSNSYKKSIEPNEILTVPEVAAYLRVSRVTVWRWCREGVIPASRIGRNWRIHHGDLLRLVGPHKLDQADGVGHGDRS